MFRIKLIDQLEIIFGIPVDIVNNHINIIVHEIDGNTIMDLSDIYSFNGVRTMEVTPIDSGLKIHIEIQPQELFTAC